jgi:hypothetical protein
VGYEISHLCNEGLIDCIDPIYLGFESHVLIISRGVCFGDPGKWDDGTGRCNNPQHKHTPCLLRQHLVPWEKYVAGAYEGEKWDAKYKTWGIGGLEAYRETGVFSDVGNLRTVSQQMLPSGLYQVDSIYIWRTGKRNIKTGNDNETVHRRRLRTWDQELFDAYLGHRNILNVAIQPETSNY